MFAWQHVDPLLGMYSYVQSLHCLRIAPLLGGPLIGAVAILAHAWSLSRHAATKDGSAAFVRGLSCSVADNRQEVAYALADPGHLLQLPLVARTGC